MLFSDKLINSIKEKKCPCVVGLDPKIDMFPNYLFKDGKKDLETIGKAIFEFNKNIIDNIYDIVPAIKPQLAYYEMYGLEGLKAFLKTIEYAKSKGMLVIVDGKRNDIGSTASAYANAYLDKNAPFKCDALTVNPYLGIDGIKPFIEKCEKYEKGIFILLKTSNPSSGQLQDIKTESDRYNYEIIADLINEWGKTTIGDNNYSSICAVVGATYPEQGKSLRSRMKNTIFLVPGFGAQGGTANDVAVNFDENGMGAIVNSSRGIIYAYKKEEYSNLSQEEYGLASRKAAIKMRDSINEITIKEEVI